jgi:type IV pilus assembly protein PilB
MASQSGVRHVLDQYKTDLSSVGVAAEASQAEAAASAEKDIKTIVQDSPISRALSTILEYAVKTKASDIHIEPFAERIRVRYRIDGVLVERDNPPRRLLAPLLSRLKIMANMDIAEKRRCQDGRIKLTLGGKHFDMRVSMLPTCHGQSCVMRILDRSNINVSIKDLGFSETDYARFNNIIKRPNGIFLVTGPTGSGKTTTLYGAVNYLNNEETSIVTAEDPVEYVVDGISQCSINTQLNITFEETLRHMVRQDPDVIVLGEIRDNFSAEAAIQAALTGHKVLTTFHTEDTIGGLLRLMNMDIETFLISSTVVSSTLPRANSAIISVALAPMMCTPSSSLYFGS